MAQKQYVKYLDPLISWIQNTSFLGILNPGRYCGFDSLQVTGANAIRIGHTQTGVKTRDFNQTLLGPWGTWVSKQGVIIQETSFIPNTNFVIDSNAGNDFWRYDVLVGEHEYVPISGEQTDATYFIIKGQTSSYSFDGVLLPPLPNPDKQVILAIIAIPPQETSMLSSNIKLIKVRTPDTGAEIDAKLNEPNSFKAIQQELFSPNIIYSPESEGKWLLSNKGNGFNILPTPASYGGITNNVPQPHKLNAIRIEDAPVQKGTKITLRVNGNVAIFNDYMPDTNTNYWFNRGYRPIVFDKRFCNYKVNDGGTERNVLRASKPFTITPNYPKGDPQETYMILTLELIQDKWVVKDVFHQNSSTYQNSLLIADMNPGDVSGFNPYSNAFSWPTIQTISPTWVKYDNYGGLPFASFNGNSIYIKERGLVEVNINASLRIDFSPLLGNPIVYNPAYIGPGSVKINLIHSSNATSETYLLDSRDSAEMSHQHLGGYVANTSFAHYYNLKLKGSRVLRVYPGDYIQYQLVLQNGYETIIWEFDASTKGMNSIEVKFLGSGEEYSGVY